MGVSNEKDLDDYRNGYPGLEDNPRITENYEFYSGKIRSRPQGDKIDVIHEKWWGDTELLESHHGYIQWLFPIREHGMNAYSYPLQLHEIEKIKADAKCMERFLKSYELILDFYGLELKDKETGALKKNHKWKKQFINLNLHTHNNLRITRILKCLGELGKENYKIPFMEFFIKQIFLKRRLRNCARSCRSYWLGTIKDDQIREDLDKKIESYENDFSNTMKLAEESNKLKITEKQDSDSNHTASTTDRKKQSSVKNGKTTSPVKKDKRSKDDDDQNPQVKKPRISLKEPHKKKKVTQSEAKPSIEIQDTPQKTKKNEKKPKSPQKTKNMVEDKN